MEIFECSPLGKELKAQTDISKKQYQKLENGYKLDEESTFGKYDKLDLIYNTIHSSYKYNDIKKNQ